MDVAWISGGRRQTAIRVAGTTTCVHTPQCKLASWTHGGFDGAVQPTHLLVRFEGAQVLLGCHRIPPAEDLRLDLLRKEVILRHLGQCPLRELTTPSTRPYGMRHGQQREYVRLCEYIYARRCNGARINRCYAVQQRDLDRIAMNAMDSPFSCPRQSLTRARRQPSGKAHPPALLPTACGAHRA